MEIPAYQAIDYVLGKVSEKLPEPVRGWVVTAPDSGIQTEMFTDEEAAGAHVLLVRSQSKWPASIFARPCWVHEAEMVFGAVSRRRTWSPR